MKLVYPPSPLRGLEILSCRDDRPFGRHLHDGYVLWLNSEAPERFHVKGSAEILEPGSLSVIEPGVVHSNSPCDGTRRHLRSFYFTEEFLLDLTDRTGGKVTGLPTASFRDPVFWRNLAGLHEHMLRNGDSPALEEAIIEAFALLLERCAGMAPPAEYAGEDRRTGLLADYLRANLDRQVPLTELASLANCTDFHVIRLFRRQLGMTPHAFVTQLRLEKARRLIEGGCPLADAAAQAGLCDQSHLTRMFKRRYGLTPGQYRRQRRLC